MRELIRLLAVALIIIVLVNVLSFGSGYTEVGGILTLVIVLVLLVHLMRGRRV